MSRSHFLRVLVFAVILALSAAAAADTTRTLSTDHMLQLSRRDNMVEYALDGEKVAEEQLYMALADKLSTGIKTVTILCNSSISLEQAAEARGLAEKVGFYTRLCTYSRDPEWCHEVLLRGPYKIERKQSSGN